MKGNNACVSAGVSLPVYVCEEKGLKGEKKKEEIETREQHGMCITVSIFSSILRHTA